MFLSGSGDKQEYEDLGVDSDGYNVSNHGWESGGAGKPKNHRKIFKTSNEVFFWNMRMSRHGCSMISARPLTKQVSIREK